MRVLIEYSCDITQEMKKEQEAREARKKGLPVPTSVSLVQRSLTSRTDC